MENLANNTIFDNTKTSNIEVYENGKLVFNGDMFEFLLYLRK